VALYLNLSVQENWSIPAPVRCDCVHVKTQPTGKRWKTKLGRERFLTHCYYDNRVLLNVKSWLGRFLIFLISICSITKPNNV
jgi:hypothetical protein